MSSFAIILLAAGKGTRMKSSLPKVMHRLAGQPLISHVIQAAAPLKPEKLVCVIGPDMEIVEAQVKKQAPHALCALQKEQKGTAHAVQQAKKALGTHAGPVIILYGDTPLLKTETIQAALKGAEKHALCIVGMRPEEPTGYGRLKLDKQGLCVGIVEEKDATPEERKITLCNSGILAANGKHLWALLEQVKDENASGEFYLTDVVGLAHELGLTCSVIEEDCDSLQGINTHAQLADAETYFQQELRVRAMVEGATLIAPETVFFSADTELGRDVVVQPNVWFGPGVTVEDGAEIRAFSHLEGCTVGKGAVVGPFARLRPGAVVSKGARVGNFVEIKNATLEAGAKVNHLSYVGDATVGAEANIGAGTITCNYDGEKKYRTEIGEGAFIGSNTALVAPVKIGEGALVAAGSVITEDVPAGGLGIARGRQVNKEGRAKVDKKSASQ